MNIKKSVPDGLFRCKLSELSLSQPRLTAFQARCISIQIQSQTKIKKSTKLGGFNAKMIIFGDFVKTDNC